MFDDNIKTLNWKKKSFTSESDEQSNIIPERNTQIVKGLRWISGDWELTEILRDSELAEFYSHSSLSLSLSLSTLAWQQISP